MILNAEHLDEIRASVDWQAMFTGLELRKAEGKSKPQDWWAFSPFHDEKTPSFHMAPGAVWFDFSVGEGGGPIELIQKLEGGNCYEAGRVILDRGWAHASVDVSQPVTRVILSHLGRAIGDDSEPKYLFYQGFHKSAELYGQELLWLHEDAAAQIAATNTILLTEGPFDVAKAVEAGLRNVVGSFGAALSGRQMATLVAMAKHHGTDTILIAFDRDKAGQTGAVKAAELIEQAGLNAQIFDWDAQVEVVAEIWASC